MMMMIIIIIIIIINYICVCEIYTDIITNSSSFEVGSGAESMNRFLDRASSCGGGLPATLPSHITQLATSGTEKPHNTSFCHRI
jgi:hypothetical protein